MMDIKIKGHALKPVDPSNRYKWECSCGAWGKCLPMSTAMARAKSRRNEHSAHKIEVLIRQGKVENSHE